MSYYLIRHEDEEDYFNAWKADSLEAAKELALDQIINDELVGTEIWGADSGQVVILEILKRYPTKYDVRETEWLTGPSYFGRKVLDDSPLTRDEVLNYWEWGVVDKPLEHYQEAR
jgi:hypothetical protein